MSRARQSFSQAADAYDDHAHLQRQWQSRVMRHALDRLPEKALLADLGCGTGGFAREAKALRPQWNVIGLDDAHGMCRAARAHGPVVQANAAALPFARDALDGVVSSLCLQWVGPKARALREVARVLRPGGQAMLMTLGEGTLQELRNLAPELPLLPMSRADDYRQWAEAAGLEVQIETQRETYQYESLTALLRSMKRIGAGSAGNPARMAPRWFRQVSAAYAAAYPASQGGVLASWQPVLLTLKKPA